MVDLLLGLVIANVIGLLLWRATADYWPSPRLRGFAIGVFIASITLLIELRWPNASRLAWLGNPRLVVLAIALQSGLVISVYIRGVSRPFYREAAKNPDARDEERSPLEHSSDDGEYLCDVIDLSFGSTRPEQAPKDLSESIPRVIKAELRDGQRVVHSWGSGARGCFQPELNAGRITDAPVFQLSQAPISACVRFSNFNSESKRDDNQPGPRGMAIRLQVDPPGPKAVSVDIVALSLDRFFARTREDFVSFSRAMARPAPARYLWLLFLLITGRTRTPVVWQLLRMRAPHSYLDLTYHGVNAFWFTRRGPQQATRTPIRFLVEPVPPQPSDVAGNGGPRADQESQPQVGGASGQHLNDELRARLTGGDARFILSVVDGSGLPLDRINDALVPWKRRPVHRLGTLVLSEFQDDGFDCYGFNPHNLCRGIEPSDDEILMARRAAYPASVRRRRNLQPR